MSLTLYAIAPQDIFLGGGGWLGALGLLGAEHFASHWALIVTQESE
jgi:hypothetical protein